MAELLAQSQTDVDNIKTLLDKQLPSYRKAYSDRTSWLMSCLAELAYIRFNPLFAGQKNKTYFIDEIKKLIDAKRQSTLEKLIDAVAYDPVEEEQDLISNLTLLSFDLIEKYDRNGTQAIIVANKDMAILAFRGTEATSIKDIKADAKAFITACPSGGSIHSGFNDAYNEVGLDIQNRLHQDDLKNIPLYITGHSLGGALATIGAKKLTHPLGGIAACYTYGSPRVGDEIWGSTIKAPIYRVVNAADCVTMLPPSDELISIVGWGFRLIPNVGKGIQSFILQRFKGYLHVGNMRYMTNCKTSDYSGVKLLYSVSWWYRIIALYVKKLRFKKVLTDHSIATYRKKLLIIARNRN